MPSAAGAVKRRRAISSWLMSRVACSTSGVSGTKCFWNAVGLAGHRLGFQAHRFELAGRGDQQVVRHVVRVDEHDLDVLARRHRELRDVELHLREQRLDADRADRQGVKRAGDASRLVVPAAARPRSRPRAIDLLELRAGAIGGRHGARVGQQALARGAATSAGRPAVRRMRAQRVDGRGLVRSSSPTSPPAASRLGVVARNRRQRGDCGLAQRRREVAAEPHACGRGRQSTARRPWRRSRAWRSARRRAARRGSPAPSARYGRTTSVSMARSAPRSSSHHGSQLARREGRRLAGLRDVGVAVDGFCRPAAEVAAGDAARLARGPLWRDVRAAAQHLDLCQPQRAVPAGQQHADVAAADGHRRRRDRRAQQRRHLRVQRALQPVSSSAPCRR